GGAEALERRDLLADECLDRGRARRHRFTVDEHGAGVSLLQAAADLRCGEPEVVPEDVQERRRRIDGDSALGAVHSQHDLPGHDLTLGSAEGRSLAPRRYCTAPWRSPTPAS